MGRGVDNVILAYDAEYPAFQIEVDCAPDPFFIAIPIMPTGTGERLSSQSKIRLRIDWGLGAIGYDRDDDSGYVEP